MICSLFTLQLLLDELSLRSKAIHLVDSVLEQSVQYISSRVEHPEAAFDFDIDHQQPKSLRGPQALRFSDLEYDEDEFPKENLNDHYFDQPSALNVNIADNFLHSDSENFAITCDLSNDAEFLKSPTIESISGKSFDENMSPQDERDLLDLHMPVDKLDHANVDISERMVDKIDRKFDRLPSQLDAVSNEVAFELTLDGEDVSQLQNEFSKLSWDESQSTTAEHNLSTPDNDLHGHEGDLGAIPHKSGAPCL